MHCSCRKMGVAVLAIEDFKFELPGRMNAMRNAAISLKSDYEGGAGKLF